MANETKNKSKGWRSAKFLALSLLCIFSFTGCTKEEIEDGVGIALDVLEEVLAETEVETNVETKPETDFKQTSKATTASNNKTNSKSETVTTVSGEMTVHFIDVGQADATLFVQNGQTMLFDAATRNRGDDVVEYIKNLGIDYIDVLVLSHPHDDHMGGSAEILNNIEVGTVYGPDIFSIKSLDTIGWYNNMVDAIDTIDEERNKDVAEDNQTSIWNFPRKENGEFAKFNIGDAIVEFYAPFEEEYSDLNDYSICAKVTFGTIDVFLTGDATTSVEEALISEGYNLDVEIFQAGHHGSDTSNSKEFLEAMSPESIVISCGMENKYNHPVKSVVELYKEMEIPVYRTDESGSIVMTTDGTNYSFNKNPGTYTSGEEYRNNE